MMQPSVEFEKASDEELIREFLGSEYLAPIIKILKKEATYPKRKLLSNISTSTEYDVGKLHGLLSFTIALYREVGAQPPSSLREFFTGEGD